MRRPQDRRAEQGAATLEMMARAVIDQHIEARRKDKAFMERLKARRERERQLFERLAK